jgi:hypothetical protein
MLKRGTYDDNNPSSLGDQNNLAGAFGTFEVA